MKRIALIIFSCLIAQNAWAGWVVTYKDVESGEQSHEYYEGNKASLGDLIYNGSDFIVIDRDSQAYWRGSPQQYCNALKAQMQKMQSMVPAQYRPKPISQKKVTRNKLGTKSIAGYSSTGWEFFVDGSQSGQVWVSSDSGLSDIIGFEQAQSKKMKCFDEIDSMGVEGSKLYKQTVEGGFILRNSGREVTSVERKSVSSGQFKEPSGLKAFSDYQQFSKYASNHGSSSSSSSMPSQSYGMPEQSSRRSREGGSDRRQSENVIEKDAKDIGQGAVDEAHQSTKRGIQDGVSDSIQDGVKGLMDKLF